MEKIFVSIISCRENFLEQTILSAINNSYNPDRILFGVFNTVIDEESFSLDIKNVFINNYKSKELLGIGFSRKKSIEMCPDDVEYILQVDAHMIFEKNWDKSLIEKINKIELSNKNIIISSFLNSWTIDSNNKIIVPELGESDPNNIPASLNHEAIHIGFADQYEEAYPKTWGVAKKWDGKEYMEVNSVSGNFVFSRAKTFKDIPHDERCYWGADEGIFAMRAWTRGYKIFTINNKIAYHLDKNKDTMSRIKKDWRDFYKKKNSSMNFDNDLDSTYLLLSKIFLGEELGIFGAPNIEMLENYEDFCNFSFKDFYKKRKNDIMNMGRRMGPN